MANWEYLGDVRCCAYFMNSTREDRMRTFRVYYCILTNGEMKYQAEDEYLHRYHISKNPYFKGKAGASKYSHMIQHEDGIYYLNI